MVEGVREVSWSTEAIALVVTGGMLAIDVITSFHPRVALSVTSKVIFGVGAVVFLGAGAAAVGGVDFPRAVVVLPLVPLSITVALVSLGIRHPAPARPSAGPPPATFVPAGAAAPLVAAVPVVPAPARTPLDRRSGAAPNAGAASFLGGAPLFDGTDLARREDGDAAAAHVEVARHHYGHPHGGAPFDAHGAGAERLLAASPYATPAELSELAYARPELRPAIAANPTAPASLLQWLTEQAEPAVLAAIAARGSVAG